MKKLVLIFFISLAMPVLKAAQFAKEAAGTVEKAVKETPSSLYALLPEQQVGIKDIIRSNTTAPLVAEDLRSKFAKPEFRPLINNPLFVEDVTQEFAAYHHLTLDEARKILALTPEHANPLLNQFIALTGKETDPYNINLLNRRIVALLDTNAKPTYEHLIMAVQNMNEGTPALVALLLHKGAPIQEAPAALITALYSDKDVAVPVLGILLENGGYELIQKIPALKSDFEKFAGPDRVQLLKSQIADPKISPVQKASDTLNLEKIGLYNEIKASKPSPVELPTQAPAASPAPSSLAALSREQEASIRSTIRSNLSAPFVAKDLRSKFAKPEFRPFINNPRFVEDVTEKFAEYHNLPLDEARKILALTPEHANPLLNQLIALTSKETDQVRINDLNREIATLLETNAKPTYDHLETAVQNMNERTPLIVAQLLHAGAPLQDGTQVFKAILHSSQEVSLPVLDILLKNGGFEVIQKIPALKRDVEMWSSPEKIKFLKAKIADPMLDSKFKDMDRLDLEKIMLYNALKARLYPTSPSWWSRMFGN